MNYQCTFSHSFMSEFGEKFMQSYEGKIPTKILRAVHFSLMELMQNISFYSTEVELVEDKSYGKGQIEIELNTDYLLLTASNSALPEQYKKIKAKVDLYNSLDFDELKQLSKELRRSENEDSKGGGIGLVEIRRKSKNLIKCEYIADKIIITIRFNLGEIDG